MLIVGKKSESGFFLDGVMLQKEATYLLDIPHDIRKFMKNHLENAKSSRGEAFMLKRCFQRSTIMVDSKSIKVRYIIPFISFKRFLIPLKF